jgi:hypothetical protein
MFLKGALITLLVSDQTLWGMLNSGFLILMYELYRCQLVEFGEKVLGLKAVDIINTPAYDLEFQEAAEVSDDLFRAKVLAYSTSTWKGYASSIKGFLQFCATRELSPFVCTPSILNLYMLHAAQAGKSAGFFDSFLSAWSFISQFFQCPDYTKHVSVHTLKKFTEKACKRKTNKKLPFGAAEVRKLWNKIYAEKGGVENLPIKDFLTFMMAVFQHKTFCRFSDLQNIQLTDIFHEVDYFKIHVKYTKTDQQGKGQWLYLARDSSTFRDAHMLMCLYIHHLELETNVPSPHVYLFPPLE